MSIAIFLGLMLVAGAINPDWTYAQVSYMFDIHPVWTALIFFYLLINTGSPNITVKSEKGE